VGNRDGERICPERFARIHAFARFTVDLNLAAISVLAA
jgi:hypothetical protein